MVSGQDSEAGVARRMLRGGVINSSDRGRQDKRLPGLRIIQIARTMISQHFKYAETPMLDSWRKVRGKPEEARPAPTWARILPLLR